MGILRIEPSNNKNRTFGLTMRGREEAASQADLQSMPIAIERADQMTGSFSDEERQRFAQTAQAAQDLAIETFLSGVGSETFSPEDLAAAVDNRKFDTRAAVQTLRAIHREGRVTPGGGGWQVALDPQQGPFFHVRVQPVDARDLMSGPIYALDMSEKQLIENFVGPYQEGRPIEFEDRRLENYRKPKVTRTNKSGRETVEVIRERQGKSKLVHAPHDAEEMFFQKASREVTEEYIAGGSAARSAGASPAPSQPAIFVVHGHGRKDEVARFLRKVTGREPVVLGERAGRGRTIIEKFDDEAGDAAYAVVLLTADDMGRSKEDSNDKLRPRARQNVVLELGYFIGRIGRENLAVLYEEDVEIPSDYKGVEYISFSDNWQTKLMRELRGAGIEVSAAAL